MGYKGGLQTGGSSKVKMLEHEINILAQVNHAHIIHLQEVYCTSKMTYLVTELCAGGELKQLLQRKTFFTEDETRNIVRSLADAVVYLHKRNIIHRDLKLENILVKNHDEDDNSKINIKVTDFGLSVQTEGVGIDNIMTEACGTLIYMAPEMLSGRGYSQWCDVWSVGVIMYMLLCGETPFVSKTRTNLLKEIRNKEFQFAQNIWNTVSDAAKNLLTCLLKVDPAYRISAHQLLENPWITGDTNVSATPCNVLELMRHHLEQQDRVQTLKRVSPTPSEDAMDPSEGPEADVGRGHAQPEENVQQETCKNRCGNAPPTPLTQLHAGVKPANQQRAKQPRPRDVKNGRKGPKVAPRVRVGGNQRPSTSSKSRTDPHKPTSACTTNTVSL
ncbi:serine/threonine-protein kinase 33 isoform X2 [Antennarius striatus]|uniref:serine/threonine-protein kinase 33 isoform X2 n=1 Tax=Antennarius striatus TaxID=241820 RepID=UPI0035B163CF